MRHVRYSGLYCLKCGAAQTLGRGVEYCPALVNKLPCKGTAFTSSVGLIQWDTLNDEDANYLKSIRASTEDVK